MTWLIALLGGVHAAALLALVALPRRCARPVCAAAGILGAGLALTLAGIVLVSGATWQVSLPSLFALGGATFRLDALSAWLLGLTGLGALPASWYGFGYARHYDAPGGRPRQLAILTLIFLGSLYAVPLAHDAVTFLVCWEILSLSSYGLVIHESERPAVLEAGLWYAAMTHAGVVALMGAFFSFGAAVGSLDFESLRAGAAQLDPGLRNAIFVMTLIGFGSKAGMVPLHVWLPKAHPAAPSHISALLSGVMLKLGIYGLLRLGVDLLGPGPTWWGASLLILGAASALVGILYALMEVDLKRLLAFSSVENIGLILIGIGAGMIFLQLGAATLAGLALLAALYHAVNHTLFKGLLFLGAGAVVQTTQTRHLERYGGLIRRLPWTAACFLVGAAAIAALPPLNGFVSEWLIFQALLRGSALSALALKLVFTIAIAALALTAGLAATCFVRAFGITFLALPRSSDAAEAREVGFSQRAAMILLAGLCLAFGILPALVLPLLAPSLPAGARFLRQTASTDWPGRIATPVGFTTLDTAGLALLLLLSLALVPLLLFALRAARGSRIADTWGCGRVVHTPRMEYTASAFAEPILRIFASLYQPRRSIQVVTHADSRYFRDGISVESEITPWFEERLYQPLVRGLRSASLWVRRVQAGHVHLYLTYIFLALLALLLLVT
ncbi:MAG TPA: hydrogenase 4 subunit B [Acidobacteriota bacterium]